MEVTNFFFFFKTAAQFFSEIDMLPWYHEKYFLPMLDFLQSIFNKFFFAISDILPGSRAHIHWLFADTHSNTSYLSSNTIIFVLTEYQKHLPKNFY